MPTTNKLGIGRRVDGRGAAAASDALGEAFSSPCHPSGRGFSKQGRQNENSNIQHDYPE